MSLLDDHLPCRDCTNLRAEDHSMHVPASYCLLMVGPYQSVCGQLG